MRETLFNWLQTEIHGARCLDLFAGSGALGLEALSRGASALLAVEQHRAAAQRLRENVKLLNEQAAAEVLQREALSLLTRPPPVPFGIAFLDPPFAQELLAAACRLLEKNHWLTPAAWIYLEQDAARPWPELPQNWSLHREGRAGQSAQRLLRRNSTG